MSTLPKLAATYPELKSILRVAEDKYGCTPARVLRRAAVAGNTSLLRSQLPPMLLDDRLVPGTNLLYGSVQPPVLSHVGYHANAHTWPSNAQSRHLLGVVFAEINKQSVPCVVYQLTVGIENVPTLVCHMYNAPLSTLEHELFDEKRTATPLEIRLHEPDTADTCVRLRAETGKHIRRGGFENTPAFLYSGEYHLMRDGPMPFTHLRDANCEEELHAAEELCKALLCAQISPPFVASHIANVDDGDRNSGWVELSERPKQLWTIFDRARAPPLADNPDCHAEHRSAAKRLANGTAVPWCALAILFYGESADDEACLLEARRMTCAHTPSFPSIECSNQADATASTSRITTINLRHANTTSNLFEHHPQLQLRIMSKLRTEDELLKFTNEVFTEADSLFAAKGLLCTSANRHSLDVVHDIARRVCPPLGMLTILLDESHTVLDVRIINSNVNISGIPFAEASRLLTFPWLTPICVFATGAGKNNVALVDGRTRWRTPLEVVPSVQMAYVKHSALYTRQLATRDDIDQLRCEVQRAVQRPPNGVVPTTTSTKRKADNDEDDKAAARKIIDSLPVVVAPTPLKNVRLH